MTNKTVILPKAIRIAVALQQLWVHAAPPEGFFIGRGRVGKGERKRNRANRWKG